MSCGETYNPFEAGDERFAGFKDLKINFTCGIDGWMWRAVNNAHYEATSGDLGLDNLEAAITDCLTSLAKTPLVVISAPRTPIGQPSKKLAKLLGKWDAKFKA